MPLQIVFARLKLPGLISAFFHNMPGSAGGLCCWCGLLRTVGSGRGLTTKIEWKCTYGHGPCSRAWSLPTCGGRHSVRHALDFRFLSHRLVWPAHQITFQCCAYCAYRWRICRSIPSWLALSHSANIVPTARPWAHRACFLQHTQHCV